MNDKAESARVMPDRVRAFVALRMSAEVEQAVADFIESIQPAGDPSGGGIRWVRRNNLHLTLRFLGREVAAAALEQIDRGLGEIASATAPFTIAVRGAGAFPNLAWPRVIWVGLESPELVALAARVEAAAVEAGLPPERRAFSPHLTIGRVRRLIGWGAIRRAITAAAERDFGRTEAESMILYRSILGTESSTYEELAHYPFGSRA